MIQSMKGNKTISIQLMILHLLKQKTLSKYPSYNLIVFSQILEEVSAKILLEISEKYCLSKEQWIRFTERTQETITRIIIETKIINQVLNFKLFKQEVKNPRCFSISPMKTNYLNFINTTNKNQRLLLKQMIKIITFIIIYIYTQQ
ncbi:unnamed protein product [Paramecium octaurelia]|uniref:Transmembrane protein n=1 Tax=Paramecium octaurelia TaxID=43137 RepID=A0A8S1XZJ5_PAROT|nr:unnamed protein product [Paramecium octaurelia]